ncbi:MAG TPA: hypothetical protein VMR75_00570 [Candidatus Saccharimonadales bacterium]|nr:hypothetical protein [Candidatus Saccharimonadales bacterium]
MKLYLLYTKDTPADRDIAYLQRRLAERQLTPELLDADSRAGITLAGLYDVTARPALVVADSDGRLIQKWQGALPGLEELNLYYTAG